jgi:hypothetical protein
MRYSLSDLQSIIDQKNEGEPGIRKQSPVYSFMYALKSSEARRQYPKRLKMLFDFLGLPDSLEEQATEFLEEARTNPQGSQNRIIAFLIHNNLAKCSQTRG